MSTLTFLALLLAAPASDRAVEPVAVEAPPEPTPPANTTPTTTPTPAPADAAITPTPVAPTPAPITIQPTPYTAPPPPPPAPQVRRPDRPIRWRVDIVGGVGGALHRDPAWRAFDRDRRVIQPAWGLRADFRLASSRVFLGAGAFFRRFTGGGDLHDTLYSHVLVREPIAALRASIVTVEGLDVIVQAGGGPSIVDLDLNSGTQYASQRSVVAMVDALAGVALYLPKRWLPRRGASRVTGGLELSAGYTWRGDVDVRPALVPPEDPIAADTTAFGDLALRGLTWRFALFIRFQ
jgi:hypothetical protein